MAWRRSGVRIPIAPLLSGTTLLGGLRPPRRVVPLFSVGGRPPTPPGCAPGRSEVGFAARPEILFAHAARESCRSACLLLSPGDSPKRIDALCLDCRALPIRGEGELVRSVQRTSLVVFLSGFLAFAAIAPVAARIQNVGGGKWDHGMTTSRVYSNYLHEAVCHSSTAVGTVTSTGKAPAGRWSYASAPRADRNNATYWNNDVSSC
ncbi:lactococcin 972 family bacteriocin [Nocardiopsis sp. NPDC006938]|uniref:lactococcin 972 family bacteriocin n=1 Tax=Nocardiopsis sp. NPDC006938 TaxID=3364337 RepID=UPI0036D08F2F